MIFIVRPKTGRCPLVDHPIIKQFEAHAELLDAIIQLAIWMDTLELAEDDEALLCRIGAILYREGLRRRMGA